MGGETPLVLLILPVQTVREIMLRSLGTISVRRWQAHGARLLWRRPVLPRAQDPHRRRRRGGKVLPAPLVAGGGHQGGGSGRRPSRVELAPVRPRRWGGRPPAWRFLPRTGGPQLGPAPPVWLSGSASARFRVPRRKTYFRRITRPARPGSEPARSVFFLLPSEQQIVILRQVITFEPYLRLR